MVYFGQIIIGPPGSGKSTYCAAVAKVMRSMGRKVGIINLDFANEEPPYKPEIDIQHLITVDDVMDHMKLGPNGSLMYCANYLKENCTWLENWILKLGADCYLLFDFPGQVELYTHDTCIQQAIKTLSKNLDLRLACVNLIDSHYCSEPSKFIAACATCLAMMLRLALPHINVLSKMDLIDCYGKPEIGLNYFLETLSLDYICQQLSDDPLFSKFAKLNQALCSVIEDYSLVNFAPLCVTDENLMMKLIKMIDKVNGYVFGDQSTAEQSYKMMSHVFRESDFDFERGPALEEVYLSSARQHKDA